LNAFGQAFRDAGWKWTEELCKADSDGDGQTNGEELGDPCCQWKDGDLPSMHMASSFPSHPGLSSHTREAYEKPDCNSAEVQPSVKVPKMAAFQPGEIQKHMDFIIKSYAIPPKETTYVDMGFNFDDDAHSLYHIVYADALVDQPKHLHHFVLTGCSEKIPPNEVGMPRNQGAHPSCNMPLGGTAFWAPGMTMFSQPIDSGIPIGAGANILGINVNVHYTDGNLYPGAVSQDGFRLFYTPTLRPNTMYGANVLSIGQNQFMAVPPGIKRNFLTRTCEIEVVDSCPAGVSRNSNGDPEDWSDAQVQQETSGSIKSCQEVKEKGYCSAPEAIAPCPVTCGHCISGQKQATSIPVVASYYHAHLLGTEMYASVKRGGEEIDFGSQKIWHYEDQTTFSLQARNLTIQNGDVFQATCVYNSMNKTEPTVFGLNTRDEMCFVVLMTEHSSDAPMPENGGFRCKGQSRMWTGQLSENEDATQVANLHPYLDAEWSWVAEDHGFKLRPGQSGPDSSKCTSPNGNGGYDCYACEEAWGEPQTCADGYEARDLGRGEEEYCPYACWPTTTTSTAKHASEGAGTVGTEDAFASSATQMMHLLFTAPLVAVVMSTA
jgi:hypothetical protein